jgi:hypothetical protein
MNRSKHIFIILVFAALISSCERDKPSDNGVTTPPVQAPLTPPENFTGLFFATNGTLTLQMNHVFGGQALRANPSPFVVAATAANDTVTVTDLVYYVSHIKLTKSDNSVINLKNNHLLNHATGRTAITVNVPAGHYTRMEFLLGVDSVNNHSGLQDGDLDAANGMFWTWSTGYIFYRVIGRHSASNTAFVYHIGGLQNLINISFDLNAYAINKNNIAISCKHDLATFFNSPNVIDLKTMVNQVHTATNPIIPSLTANMAGMFSITSIQ